ncbi:MAG: hypothetical protein P4M13_05420 [Alphaproteobacteria bacterium]|nr:hypothetical protein [Alphaproteobacteria bacterium]
MMNRSLIIPIAMVLLLRALPAWADTDYRCLSLCLKEGCAQGRCLAACASDRGGAKPVSALKPPEGILSHHRILPDLRSIDRSVILPDQKPPSPYRKTTDYGCVAQCLGAKMQYQTCTDRCASVEMKNGKVVRNKKAENGVNVSCPAAR